GCPDCDTGDRHAFDEDERVAFHDHAVGKGAAVAFVGVADNVFLVCLRIEDGLPLNACGEACTATAAQTGLLHLVDDFCRGQSKCLLKPLVSAMRLVVSERHRIGDAATCKRQTDLT